MNRREKERLIIKNKIKYKERNTSGLFRTSARPCFHAECYVWAVPVFGMVDSKGHSGHVAWVLVVHINGLLQMCTALQIIICKSIVVLQTLKLQVVAFLIQNALIFSFLELILKI
jgi:hypothetical protein